MLLFFRKEGCKSFASFLQKRRSTSLLFLFFRKEEEKILNRPQILPGELQYLRRVAVAKAAHEPFVVKLGELL